MGLTKLPSGIFSQERNRIRTMKNIYGNETTVEEESSTVSVIDDVLDVIGCDYLIDEDYEVDCESVEEVMIVPVKFDTYDRRRSSTSSRLADKRRRELLLDNASAITEALIAELSNNDMEEDDMSLDPEDIDESYRSNDM